MAAAWTDLKWPSLERKRSFLESEIDQSDYFYSIVLKLDQGVHHGSMSDQLEMARIQKAAVRI